MAGRWHVGHSWAGRNAGRRSAAPMGLQTDRRMRTTVCRRRTSAARRTTAELLRRSVAKMSPCAAQRTTARPEPRRNETPYARRTNDSHCRRIARGTPRRLEQRFACLLWPVPRQGRSQDYGQNQQHVWSRKLTTWECSSKGERSTQGGGDFAAAQPYCRPWPSTMQGLRTDRANERRLAVAGRATDLIRSRRAACRFAPPSRPGGGDRKRYPGTCEAEVQSFQVFSD